jgi:hypothetical protein
MTCQQLSAIPTPLLPKKGKEEKKKRRSGFFQNTTWNILHPFFSAVDLQRTRTSHGRQVLFGVESRKEKKSEGK